MGNSFLILHPLPQPRTHFYLPPLNDPPIPMLPCYYHLTLLTLPHISYFFFFVIWYTARIELLTFGSVVLLHLKLARQATVASNFIGITSYWSQTDTEKFKLVWKKQHWFENRQSRTACESSETARFSYICSSKCGNSRKRISCNYFIMHFLKNDVQWMDRVVLRDVLARVRWLEAKMFKTCVSFTTIYSGEVISQFTKVLIAEKL